MVPAPFWMSDGSSYCVGTEGVEVTLEGSESGIDYELLLDGVSTGNVIAGTGSALSFGFKTTEGIYTIVGFTNYCEFTMHGTAFIYPVDLPAQADIPLEMLQFVLVKQHIIHLLAQQMQKLMSGHSILLKQEHLQLLISQQLWYGAQASVAMRLSQYRVSTNVVME